MHKTRAGIDADRGFRGSGWTYAAQNITLPNAPPKRGRLGAHAMYTGFYGLREKPFSLAPDPRYLFLSASHREALAHLLYGIEEGEGFIEVIGQVGTGKTTLCRTLLGPDRPGRRDRLHLQSEPERGRAARRRSTASSACPPRCARARSCSTSLNQFLLEKNAAGRRVLLVIDEAQNLDPAVLEQVRLLSNLETDRAKLLQIVLIGQPELEENLARSDLRQLRQRITVRWTPAPALARRGRASISSTACASRARRSAALHARRRCAR